MDLSGYVTSIFFESDRRIRPDPDGTEPQQARSHEGYFYEYATNAVGMRERLDALGYTASKARSDYAKGHANEKQQHDELRENMRGWPISKSREDSDWKKLAIQEAERERLDMDGWTFDFWCDAIGRLALQKIDLRNEKDWADDPAANLFSRSKRFGAGDCYGFGDCFSDIRLQLRAVLDAIPSAKEVVLDYTGLVSDGIFAPEERVSENLRRENLDTYPDYGPIVILTEGRSDTRVLSAALKALAPHLAEVYSFLDFDGMNIEGGAGALAKTVRAFAGARVVGRMVAVFDNDAAGTEALSSLADFELPANIRAIQLPNCEIGMCYPTIGPQGPMRMNINGCACSIELYLGRDALLDDFGELQPIRWTGYNKKLDRYQGAVAGKTIIASRFISALAKCASPLEARSRFPDLADVIDTIGNVFTEFT